MTMLLISTCESRMCNLQQAVNGICAGKFTSCHLSIAETIHEQEAGDHAGDGGGSDEKRGAADVSASSCSGGTSNSGAYYGEDGVRVHPCESAYIKGVGCCEGADSGTQPETMIATASQQTSDRRSVNDNACGSVGKASLHGGSAQNYGAYSRG